MGVPGSTNEWSTDSETADGNESCTTEAAESTEESCCDTKTTEADQSTDQPTE